MCNSSAQRCGCCRPRCGCGCGCGCGCHGGCNGGGSPTATLSLADYQTYVIVPTSVFEEAEEGCGCGCGNTFHCGCARG